MPNDLPTHLRHTSGDNTTMLTINITYGLPPNLWRRYSSFYCSWIVSITSNLFSIPISELPCRQFAAYSFQFGGLSGLMIIKYELPSICGCKTKQRVDCIMDMLCDPDSELPENWATSCKRMWN